MIAPTNTSTLAEYAKLLIELHELIRRRTDNEQGDELRDRMDVRWAALSDEERSLVTGLSADLKTIGVDRPGPTTQPDSESHRRFTEAATNKAWSSTLEHLRDIEDSLPSSQVAYIRGACWAYLTQPHIACVFLLEKERIAALDAGEEILLLTCLLQDNRLEEALSRANHIASNEAESAPALLLKAAEISVH